MEIEEFRRLRADAESAIRANAARVVAEFYEKTGICIDSVDIEVAKMRTVSGGAESVVVGCSIRTDI
jgi:hypothetical protein